MATLTEQNPAIKFNPNDMLNATRRLSEIMISEVNMLENMQLSDLHTTYNEKMKLTSILESYKKILIENPGIMKSFSSDVVAELRTQSFMFDRILEEEEKQLKKTRRVHQILMQAIKETVNKNLMKSGGYTKNGSLDNRRISESKTPPITLDKNV